MTKSGCRSSTVNLPLQRSWRWQQKQCQDVRVNLLETTVSLNQFRSSKNPKSKIKNLLPLCLSSHRASFVNSYSSVRVRPGAPFQWWSWCNSSTAPRDGVSIGANPFGHPNFDRRKLIGQEFPHSAFESGLWCNSSISAREADGPGANPGFLTKRKRAASAQGDWPIRKRILLKEQSQPRHYDLNAGIWMRAVRRA